MKEGQFTVKTIESEEGKYITQKNVDNILNAFLSKRVILAVNDNIDNYKEVDESEAELIRQAKKEHNPSLYPTEDEKKISKVSYFRSLEKNINSIRNEINTLSLTDNESLEHKMFYPIFDDIIGKEVEVGFKLVSKNSLYKVKQAHTLSAEWRPESTESLFEEINEKNKGTIDDPISYNNNMELFSGKYYIQDGITYYCNRGTGQAVYNPLADLVGIYVEVAE